MATKCPRCGSKNTECINRVEQIGDGIKKYSAVAAGFALSAFGHPNLGKTIAGLPINVDIRNSIYKCKSCSHEFN